MPKKILTNAIITVVEEEGETRSRRSDAETAEYIFRNLKEGKVTITVSHPGNTDKTQDVYITHNECAVLDVYLDKTQPSI